MSVDIRIGSSGSISIGDVASCDGFARDIPVRVQTHVHADHMRGFESSKGSQLILATPGTRALLCAKYNADLPYRNNLIALDFGETFECQGNEFSLHSSEHMLGSAQLRLIMADGQIVGYSGDFAWPLDDVISVDTLIVDATYGSPRSVREYDQADAELALMRVLSELRNEGPVHIVTHQGTLQRAMQVLSGNSDIPVLCSSRLLLELQVYRDFGYAIPDVCDVRSPEGRQILDGNDYVRFFGPADQEPLPDGRVSTIKLSAFMAKPDDPIVPYSKRACGIAMSSHADFLGTMEYIQATGASRVVIDNSRGGHAFELAEAVHKRLRVSVEVPSVEVSREWGKG